MHVRELASAIRRYCDETVLPCLGWHGARPQCGDENQEKGERSRHSESNGEVEGPPRSARSSVAGAQSLPRPRRGHTDRSRSPPTIVRPRAHGVHLRRTNPRASAPIGNATASAPKAPVTAARTTPGISALLNHRLIRTAASTLTTPIGTHHNALAVSEARRSALQLLQWCVGPRKLRPFRRD